MNYIVFERADLNFIGIVSAANFIKLPLENQRAMHIMAMTNSLIVAEWVLKGLKCEANTIANNYEIVTP